MPCRTQALGNPSYLGPNGAGQSAKLANQLIVAITIGAVAEAFQLAERAGCDLAVLQKALQGGFADSRILIQHGERMVKSDYEPGGRCRSQLKDIVHNAQKVAADAGLNATAGRQPLKMVFAAWLTTITAVTWITLPIFTGCRSAQNNA